jgi:DNA recombination protein RmuC
MMEIAAAVVGALLGALAGWLIGRSRQQARNAEQNRALESRVVAAETTTEQMQQQAREARQEVLALRKQVDSARDARTRAETEMAEARKNVAEQKRLLDEARQKLIDSFKALSSDALQSNNKQFLEMARKVLQTQLADTKGELGKHAEALRGTVKPLAEALGKYEKQIEAIESSRQKAYGGLEEQIKNLGETHHRLMKETHELVTALRRPEVRGRWGEVSLRRVVELSGMSAHCDYTEQATVSDGDSRLRPDMVVHMPAGRDVVVDAKVSLDAYMDAMEAETDADRQAHVARHARQVRVHVKRLSRKDYWDQFENSPEFVVMFIPGESFFAAAADHDHDLVEFAMQQRVVLATPITLIALLRAVAYGWRQEELAENAREISELGCRLYERLRTLAGHFEDLRRGLERANESYNRAIGSLESRVFPAARGFRDLGAGTGEDIPVVGPVDRIPRKLAGQDLDGE